MARVDNETFYDASLADHGFTAKGVHWRDKERQDIRFEVMTKLLGEKLHYSSVVDAGCGLGDLYDYWLRLNRKPKRYIGIDLHMKMVEYAKEKTQQTILCADIVKDTLPIADYYLCSGALNTLERFETIMAIKNMLRFSQKGLIFNILKGDNHSKTYNKYQPQKMKEQLSFFKGKMHLIDGYLEDDFTIYLEHEGP